MERRPDRNIAGLPALGQRNGRHSVIDAELRAFDRPPRPVDDIGGLLLFEGVEISAFIRIHHQSRGVISIEPLQKLHGFHIPVAVESGLPLFIRKPSAIDHQKGAVPQVAACVRAGINASPVELFAARFRYLLRIGRQLLP
ncbi:hypothetical protein D1872_259470 [compost metagenome]